jgi:hypothetical protein
MSLRVVLLRELQSRVLLSRVRLRGRSRVRLKSRQGMHLSRLLKRLRLLSRVLLRELLSQVMLLLRELLSLQLGRHLKSVVLVG